LRLSRCNATCTYNVHLVSTKTNLHTATGADATSHVHLVSTKTNLHTAKGADAAVYAEPVPPPPYTAWFTVAVLATGPVDSRAAWSPSPPACILRFDARAVDPARERTRLDRSGPVGWLDLCASPVPIDRPCDVDGADVLFRRRYRTTATRHMHSMSTNTDDRAGMRMDVRGSAEDGEAFDAIDEVPEGASTAVGASAAIVVDVEEALLLLLLLLAVVGAGVADDVGSVTPSGRTSDEHDEMLEKVPERTLVEGGS